MVFKTQNEGESFELVHYVFFVADVVQHIIVQYFVLSVHLNSIQQVGHFALSQYDSRLFIFDDIPDHQEIANLYISVTKRHLDKLLLYSV